MSSREPLTYRIPRFSVSRPVSVVMILLSMLVVGFIAYLRIPIALFPDGLEGNMLYIQASYPNASPRDVEEKVTRKIEVIVGTVANVKKLSSYSRNGSCTLRIEFQTGTNLRAVAIDRHRQIPVGLPLVQRRHIVLGSLRAGVNRDDVVARQFDPAHFVLVDRTGRTLPAIQGNVVDDAAAKLADGSHQDIAVWQHFRDGIGKGRAGTGIGNLRPDIVQRVE